MNGVSLKTIFLILILIVVLVVIYNKITSNDNISVADEYVAIEDNTLISNDIRIGIIELDNMNPLLSNNKNVQDISRLIFDPLFTLTEEYKLEGMLAKEWSKIDENTYIIKLKEDIVWQDGEKFDISDVIFTIDMLKKLETKSIYYYNVKDISMLQEIDEYTLKIQTNGNIPYFEYNFIFPIVSSKYFTEENFWNGDKNLKPIGTGKFYISEVNNDNILLKKNPKRFDSKSIKIETITLNLYDSLASTINAFKDEKIDMFTTSNRNIEEYLTKNAYNKSEYINRDYKYLALNCKDKILENKEVRQAINSALNKEDLLKDVYNRKYRISHFPIDYGSFAYDTNNSVMACDTNVAKRLLVESGWKYSSNKWRKTINYRNLSIELNLLVNKKDSNLVKVAKNIKGQLETIGLRINIIEATDKEYNRYLKNNNYDIVVVNSSYGYSPSLSKYFGENNIANYKNEEIINILNEVQNITDDNELKQKYSIIMEINNDEVPYISLYYNKNTLIYSNNVKGTIKPNSYNLFYGIETWYRQYKNK